MNLVPYTKISPIWITDLKLKLFKKPQNLWTTYKKNLQHLGLGEEFLDMTPR